MPTCRPKRSNTGTLQSGRGRSARIVQTSRMFTSWGDQLFSSASPIAFRDNGTPYHVHNVSLCRQASSIDTRSEYAAMSIATTASSSVAA